MAAKGYTTKIKIENYTLQNIDSSFNTQIDNWIESVENYIDQQTGRNFISDTTASAKTYNGEGGSTQKFDEFVTLTKVELGEDTKTEIVTADRRTFPNNQENKHTIQLKYNYFTVGPQNVTITANWGYSAACPEDITTAATILVAGMMNYSSGPKGKTQSMTIGRYSVSYSNEKQFNDFENVKIILDSYKKYHF